MKFQFRYDKDDNIDDFTQMHATDERGNEEMSNHSWHSKRGLYASKKQKKGNSMQILIKVKRITWLSSQKDMESINIQGNYQLILIYIWINEISYERSDCSIFRKFHYPLSQVICKIIFVVDLTLKIQ